MLGQETSKSSCQIVVVALDDISEGSVISARNIQARKLPTTTPVSQGALMSTAVAIGKRAKHGIACSQILQAGDLKPTPNTKLVSSTLSPTLRLFVQLIR